MPPARSYLLQHLPPRSDSFSYPYCFPPGFNTQVHATYLLGNTAARYQAMPSTPTGPVMRQHAMPTTRTRGGRTFCYLQYARHTVVIPALTSSLFPGLYSVHHSLHAPTPPPPVPFLVSRARLARNYDVPNREYTHHHTHGFADAYLFATPTRQQRYSLALPIIGCTASPLPWRDVVHHSLGSSIAPYHLPVHMAHSVNAPLLTGVLLGADTDAPA